MCLTFLLFFLKVSRIELVSWFLFFSLCHHLLYFPFFHKLLVQFCICIIQLLFWVCSYLLCNFRIRFRGNGSQVMYQLNNLHLLHLHTIHIFQLLLVYVSLLLYLTMSLWLLLMFFLHTWRLPYTWCVLLFIYWRINYFYLRLVFRRLKVLLVKWINRMNSFLFLELSLGYDLFDTFRFGLGLVCN